MAYSPYTPILPIEIESNYKKIEFDFNKSESSFILLESNYKCRCRACLYPIINIINNNCVPLI